MLTPVEDAAAHPADAPHAERSVTVAIHGDTPSVRRAPKKKRSAPSVTLPRITEVVEDLPPLELDTDEFSLRPALFLGIGGTASHVLRRLRRRLHDRFGDLARVPILQLLTLDTDAKSLFEASRGEIGTALKESETLAIPLRRPQEYRSQSAKLLRWMSRRWLYNIPRSLQTEGLRPLGRLAFVDHADVILDGIRKKLVAASDPSAIAASSENSDVPVSYVPRVFIISSISGGTGSGMVLDVAYAVRKIQSELDLSQEAIRGLLIHSTSRHTGGTRDLSITNAYACLNELYNYSHPEGFYPGESLQKNSRDTSIRIKKRSGSSTATPLEAEIDQAAAKQAELLEIDLDHVVTNLRDLLLPGIGWRFKNFFPQCPPGNCPEFQGLAKSQYAGASHYRCAQNPQRTARLSRPGR